MKQGAARIRWSLMLLSVLPFTLVAQQPLQPDPLRYEDTIREWEAEDALNPPPANAIVVTGSSSITRWNSEMVADLSPLTVIPRGFGGSRMADVLYYVDRLLVASKPRAVVIYEGDNDTGADRLKAETIISQFEQIVARIHQALPETRVYAMSVKPSLLRWDVWPEAQRTNRFLLDMATEDQLLYYIDVANPMLQPNGEVMTDIFVEDGLHLNEKGTDIWAAAIREALMRGEARFESTDN